MEAVITGVESFGLFAMGTDLPAEGLIHISALADDFYRFDRRSHSLVGNRANNSTPTSTVDVSIATSAGRLRMIRLRVEFRKE